jgi:hypothetical protein
MPTTAGRNRHELVHNLLSVPSRRTERTDGPSRRYPYVRILVRLVLLLGLTSIVSLVTLGNRVQQNVRLAEEIRRQQQQQQFATLPGLRWDGSTTVQAAVPRSPTVLWSFPDSGSPLVLDLLTALSSSILPVIDPVNSQSNDPWRPTSGLVNSPAVAIAAVTTNTTGEDEDSTPDTSTRTQQSDDHCQFETRFLLKCGRPIAVHERPVRLKVTTTSDTAHELEWNRAVHLVRSPWTTLAAKLQSWLDHDDALKSSLSYNNNNNNNNNTSTIVLHNVTYAQRDVFRESFCPTVDPPPTTNATLRPVPCEAWFRSYIAWHNQALDVAQVLHTETFLLRMETLLLPQSSKPEASPRRTIDELRQFFRLPPSSIFRKAAETVLVEQPREPTDPPNVWSFWTVPERQHLHQLYEQSASAETRVLLDRYLVTLSLETLPLDLKNETV